MARKRSTPKRPPGRPGMGRTEEIKVRLTPSEKASIEAAAAAAGLTVSDFIRIKLKGGLR